MAQELEEVFNKPNLLFELLQSLWPHWSVGKLIGSFIWVYGRLKAIVFWQRKADN